ncbi:MAG: hypothetical protein ACR2GY_01085 [Phycisphaerales bacterium]
MPLLRTIAQHVDNRIFLRELVVLLATAVEQIAICMDVKDAACTCNQFRGDVEFSFDLLRQTGGPWLVVSLLTVGDGHMHESVASDRVASYV